MLSDAQQRQEYAVALTNVYWRLCDELNRRQAMLRSLYQELYSLSEEMEQQQERMPFLWKLYTGEYDGATSFGIEGGEDVYYTLDGWSPENPTTRAIQTIKALITAKQAKIAKQEQELARVQSLAENTLRDITRIASMC